MCVRSHAPYGACAGSRPRLRRHRARLNSGGTLPRSASGDDPSSGAERPRPAGSAAGASKGRAPPSGAVAGATRKGRRRSLSGSAAGPSGSGRPGRSRPRSSLLDGDRLDRRGVGRARMRDAHADLVLALLRRRLPLERVAPADERFVGPPLIHFLTVDSRSAASPSTVCAGGWASAPVTVMLLPGLDAGGRRDRQRRAVAQRRGRAGLRGGDAGERHHRYRDRQIPMVSVVSVFLMLLLRRPTGHAAGRGWPRRGPEGRRCSVLDRRSPQEFSGWKSTKWQAHIEVM